MAIKYLKKAIKTPSTDDHKTQKAVQEILIDLENRREEAIKEISKKFDKYEGEVIVSKEKIEEASKKVNQKTKEDIQFAHERIKKFAEHQLKHLNNDFEELRPGINITDNETLAKEAGKYANTIFHPVSTCRMGNDEKAVVNDKLVARGLENLRIVDASIMPHITSGNTNAPTIMIAEKAADMIIANSKS